MKFRSIASVTLLAAAVVLMAVAGVAASGGHAFSFFGQMHQGHMYQGPMHQGMMYQGRAGMMGFNEADVSVSDLPDGVALTFTTKTGDPAAIRSQAQFMADMFNSRSSMQGRFGHEGAMMGRGMMVSANASIEDVPGGVRLKLTPTDKSQLESLRSQARFMADRMQTSGSMMMSGMMMSGPMQLPETTVSAADTKDGVALTFTTKSQNVPELQRRVELMANMFGAAGSAYGQSGHMGMLERGMMGQGMMMLSVTTSFEKLSDGARLVLKPADPSELGALRSHVHHMADMMTYWGSRT